MACDTTVSSSEGLQAALRDVRDGGTICLGAGTYDGPVRLDRGVTLAAADGASAADVVIDGGGGPVAEVAAGVGPVTLRGLTLRNGASEIGGAFGLTGGASVVLDGCVLEELSASAKGGAVFVSDGTLKATRTIFRGNRASMGGAVAVANESVVHFEACLFIGNSGSRGAALWVHDGARVTVDGSSFVRNEADRADVMVSSTLTRSPRVAVTGSLFTGGVKGKPAGAATVTRSAFAADAAFPVDGAGNVTGDLALDDEGRPGAGSKAIGVAPGSGVSLDGRERPPAATAGAYEPR